MRIFKTPYVMDFENNRQQDIHEMQSVGIPAFVKDVTELEYGGVGTFAQSEVRTQDEIKQEKKLSFKEKHERGVFLTGQCAGAITDIKPAEDIVNEMVSQAAEQLRTASSFLSSKL